MAVQILRIRWYEVPPRIMPSSFARASCTDVRMKRCPHFLNLSTSVPLQVFPQSHARQRWVNKRFNCRWLTPLYRKPAINATTNGANNSIRSFPVFSRAGMSSGTQDWHGALCRFQNCLWLLNDQNLRRLVGFKVCRTLSKIPM